MHFNEYCALAQRTSNSSLTVEQHVINGALGLCGEAGEAYELYLNEDWDDYLESKLIEELGDVLWYCAELASWVPNEFDTVMFGVVTPSSTRLSTLCIQAAKIADIVKKATMQGHALPREKIVCHVGCVVEIISAIAQRMGTDIETIEKLNIEKLQKRYPVKFSADQSINREV